MTALDEILAAVVNDLDGATAAAVGGVDGLIVEQYPPDGPDLAGARRALRNVSNAPRAAGTVQLRSHE